MNLFRTYKSLLAALLVSVALVSCTSNTKTISDNFSKGADAIEHFASEEILDAEKIEGSHYIAVGAPLTGSYRELGRSVLEGAKLAVEEFNKTASAANKIGILTIDDGGLVGEALERAEVVVAQACLGVIGHLNSEVSIEVSRKYASHNIAQISPASTHPLFTERPDLRGYVFRTIGTDRQLGEVAANYVISNANLKKVAVLYNDRAYGVSVSGEFVRKLAKDAGKDIVFYETIPVRRKDHSETVDKVAKAKPDVVFFVGEYNDAGYLLSQLKEKLPDVQFLAGEGVHNEHFIQIAGDSAEGAIVVATEGLVGDAREEYLRRFGGGDTAFTRASYDATKILLDAMKQNNFASAELVAKSIASNKLFDPNGDLIKPNFVLYKVKGSQFTKM